MPALTAPENLRMHNESAAITSNAAGRSARSYSQQHMDSENLVPGSASLGSLSGFTAGGRLSAPSRRGRITTGPGGLTASRTQPQMRATCVPAPGAGMRQPLGGLSDITNLTEDRYQGKKGKLSTGPRIVREPSGALQPSATAPAAGLVPALDMAASRLPARPLAPPLPQTWAAQEEASSPESMEIGSPEHLDAAEERPNPQECKEYVPEIVAGFYNEETLHMPRPNYMDSQTDVNGKMRAILIDWLIEVHMKYKLRRETLYLAVNLIDRHMALLPVARRRLQLVGVVGMFVASKFEQIDPPRVADFVYITDNTYTKEDILSMECTMLTALSFRVVVPTQAHFLDYLLKANRCHSLAQEALVSYLLELALVDVRMIKHSPSRLVSAALLLSNETMGRQAWPERMAQISRHSETALRPCVEELRTLLRAAPTGSLQAVRKKYLLQQNHSVARLPEVLAA